MIKLALFTTFLNLLSFLEPNLDIKKEYIIENYNIKSTTELIGLDNDHFKLMLDECKKYNIPEDIYFRLVDKESNFKWVVNKTTGAFGYMQMMPNTFNKMCKELGLTNERTPENNIKCASYLLYKMNNRWVNRNKKNPWKWTICEYNTGLGKMKKIDNNGFVYYEIPESVLSRVLKIVNG